MAGERGEAASMGERVRKLVGLATREAPEVGATPHEVVWRENKWRLLRFEPPAGVVRRGAPVVMVPSLINRYYVLDLMPGKSMAEWLVAKGHDVYCVDWGTPGPEDRELDLAAIADRALGRAVRIATRLSRGSVSHGERGERPHLLGYCMGGTLATVFAALHPERVGSLATMAAPVRFDGEGLLGRWTRTAGFDVDALVDATGLVPWELLQGAFHMLRPTNSLAKVVTLVDRAWSDPYLDGFLALETWANDNVSIPGAFYRQWIVDFYREDRLFEGSLEVRGRPARLDAIDCPTLAVAFEHDMIAPAPGCLALVDAERGVGSPGDPSLRRGVTLSGSHIGGTTSSAAKKGLWPLLSGFWREVEAAGRGA